MNTCKICGLTADKIYCTEQANCLNISLEEERRAMAKWNKFRADNEAAAMKGFYSLKGTFKKPFLTMIVLLLIFSSAISQENYSQYNEVLGRTEFYDSHGLTGWAIENKSTNMTEYYDMNGNIVEYDQHNKKSDLSLTISGDGDLKGWKKWDESLKRYEIYDEHSNLIGFYQYYPSLDIWEFQKP